MNENIQEKLQRLKLDFEKKLPEKWVDLEEQWLSLNLHFDSDRLAQFHLSVHSLSGSSGTYGFYELSEASRDLEKYLKPLLQSDNIKSNQMNEISHLLNTLKRVLNQSLNF